MTSEGHHHGSHEPRRLHRIQFDFSDKILAQLHTLQQRLKAATRGEVVLKALKVLIWLEEHLHHGHTIIVKKPSGEMIQAHFPFLHGEKGPQHPASQPAQPQTQNQTEKGGGL